MNTIQKEKFKKILSITSIIIILFIYITTFILAIMNNSYTEKYLNAFLFASFFIPFTLYIFMWLSKLLKKHTTSEDSSKND